MNKSKSRRSRSIFRAVDPSSVYPLLFANSPQIGMSGNEAGPSKAFYGPSSANVVVSELRPVSPGSSLSSLESENRAGILPPFKKSYTEVPRGVEEGEPLATFHGLTQRQVKTLIVLALTDFVSALLLSNQNPWFPIEVRLTWTMCDH
jgi:hypothetical protein